MRSSKLRTPAKRVSPLTQLKAKFAHQHARVVAIVMKPSSNVIQHLVSLAENPKITDAQFIAELRASEKLFPEMFKRLNIAPLERFLFRANSEVYRAGHIEKRRAFEEAKA